MSFNYKRFSITCCKDCTDRYPGCHGKCEKYIAERTAYDTQKSEAMKKYETAYGLYEQRSNSIYKVTKKHRYREKYR